MLGDGERKNERRECNMKRDKAQDTRANVVLTLAPLNKCVVPSAITDRIDLSLWNVTNAKQRLSGGMNTWMTCTNRSVYSAGNRYIYLAVLAEICPDVLPGERARHIAHVQLAGLALLDVHLHGEKLGQ